MKRALLALAACTLACDPGIEVEIENATDREVLVTRVVDWDSNRRSEVLAPHSTSNVGRAVAWFVQTGPERHELPHPGREFAGRSFTSTEVYRFRVAPGGCIFALSPGGDEVPLSQPPGYPVGPQSCAAPQAPAGP